MTIWNSRKVVVGFLMAAFYFAYPIDAVAQKNPDDLVMATPSFSLQDDVIKANSKGIDVESILATALKIKPPVKSEFETNSDLEDRLAKVSE